MIYAGVDILAIPWECRGAALIYYTVRPVALFRAAAKRPWLQGDDIVSAHSTFPKLFDTNMRAS